MLAVTAACSHAQLSYPQASWQYLDKIEEIVDLRSKDPTTFSALKVWTEGPTNGERARFFKVIKTNKTGYMERKSCWDVKKKGKIRAMIAAVESDTSIEAITRWKFAEHIFNETIMADFVIEDKLRKRYYKNNMQSNLVLRFDRDQIWRIPQVDPKNSIDDRPELFWLLWTKQCFVDSDNLSWLRRKFSLFNKKMLDFSEYDLRKLVILVIHADQDVNLQKQYLSLLLGGAKLPQESLNGVAALADRIAISEGRMQEYGTQFEVSSEKCLFLPSFSNLYLVDKSRISIGLSPLVEHANKLSRAAGIAICKGVF
jgi:hypothetical protein